MAPRKKICVFTGTRAEYGLLRPLIKLIHEDTSKELQLVVSGSHLVSEFGATISEIANDGFQIADRIDMLVAGDSPLATIKSMGLGLISYGISLNTLAPDLAIVLGDRFESFSFAAAAHTLRVPLAHIHGGETTEGAFDDGFRHSITHFSTLHFTAAEAYRQKVIQLGASPSLAFNVGAIGLDSVLSIPPVTREDMAGILGVSLTSPLFLVTYHPTTAQHGNAKREVLELIAALEAVEDATTIITKANADPGGREVNACFAEFVAAMPKKRVLVSSLGQRNYISMLRLADLIIGNSSSGIIEAPSIGVPVCNIGDRQKGRFRSENIIDVDCDRASISQGIKKGLSKEFKKTAQGCSALFGNGHAAPQIMAQMDAWLKKSATDRTYRGL